MMIERYENRNEAIVALTERLLAVINVSTSLFLSGGSSFGIFESLNAKLTKAQKSSIDLYQVDERYGDPGHANSNWALLSDMDTSLYRSVHPILKANTSGPDTGQIYEGVVSQAIMGDSRKIAILGMGDDRHVAGVKPMQKQQFNQHFSSKNVAFYEWSDYERITLTLEVLRKFDNLIIFAAGANKLAAIDSLAAHTDEHKSPIHGLLDSDNLVITYAKE